MQPDPRVSRRGLRSQNSAHSYQHPAVAAVLLVHTSIECDWGRRTRTTHDTTPIAIDGYLRLVAAALCCRLQPASAVFSLPAHAGTRFHAVPRRPFHSYSTIFFANPVPQHVRQPTDSAGLLTLCVRMLSVVDPMADSQFPGPNRVAIPRPQVGIDRLPARRQTNEPRESMNCKSCRKRKVRLAPPLFTAPVCRRN